MKKIYNKLVRDKIPEIIRKNDSKPLTRVLNQKEYTKELVRKLSEEVTEFKENPSIEELADIEEVLMALRAAMGIRADALEEVRRNKAKTNGRFKKRIFLEAVEE